MGFVLKTVKVCYSSTRNLGDLLNELIIKNVIGYQVKQSNRFTCQTTGIGSGLSRFFIPESRLKSSPKYMIALGLGKISPPIQIWSAGFTYYPTEKEYSLRKNINIASVRGELTRKRLENVLNRRIDIKTGDGGLLAALLIEKPTRKKYQVGIIAHMKEQNELRFNELSKQYSNAILIDITGDPIDVLNQISQCECILSSGLHGLIVADSFGIPNKRLVYTRRLIGDDYKFDDYYSSFSASPEPFDLNKGQYPTIDSIVDDYSIEKKQVEEKQEEIIYSFSRYLD